MNFDYEMGEYCNVCGERRQGLSDKWCGRHIVDSEFIDADKMIIMLLERIKALEEKVG